jgi:hypothetical protein
MSYKVIDNFLEYETFKNIQKNIVYCANFPWFLSRSVSDSMSDIDDGYYMTHLIYEHYTVNSNHFELIAPILEKINPKALIRIKVNFYPSTEKVIHHGVHTDNEYSHNGCIFYLNTNNGKTVLKNNIEIDSIENRLLLFDPSIEHNSTTCSDDHVGRFNINFNYF